MKRDSKFTVPELPEGEWNGRLVRRDTAWNGPKVSIDFFVSAQAINHFPAGSVFVVARDGMDLLHSWGCNDKTRRRYARLAGVPFKDVQAAFKARRDAETRKRDQSEIERARQFARKHGYQFIKKGETK